ncbi:unnamed protein product [Allacma fusca]|uniref:Uncharacterized protein n=1 Tax=Allacma fusca TaxID=39272 RepID=A0A8J2JAY3_9HEXA|nr:unnamed protein product [Allacma fusca]
MPKLSFNRKLLIACTSIGFLALTLEMIALVNDIIWNIWLNEEIKKNHGKPPVSVVARYSSKKRSNSEFNDLISDLRRDKWMEPLALAVLFTNSVTQVLLCKWFYSGKVTENSAKMTTIVSVISQCNFITAALITTSLIYYDTNYALLSRGVAIHGQFYGDYKELRHCQLNANLVLSSKKPVRTACQFVEVKITAVVLVMLSNIMYLATFYIAIINFLESSDGSTEDVHEQELQEEQAHISATTIPNDEMVIERVQSHETEIVHSINHT